nr:hypothetical protein [Tanacetum cinerariifolium]
MNLNPNWISGMLIDPNNQIPGSSSNPNNNPGFSTQPSYNQMPYYPDFQSPFASQEEQMLFNQFKMQMQFNQFSQQQQPNQVTASQPQADQQSYHLVDETEEDNEDEPIPTPTSKKTSRGSCLKSKAKKSKEKETHHFGDDALPRPPGLQRIAKSQRSGSNATASSGSNPMMYQEFMKEQYELDRKENMEVIERETQERMRLIHSQRIAEDMKVLRHTRDGSDRRGYHQRPKGTNPSGISTTNTKLVDADR